MNELVDRDMDSLEQTVQNHLKSFTKILPFHVETWKKLLDEAEAPARALSNYAEQLRHVERSNIKEIDNFEEIKGKLLFKIYSEIEDELQTLKLIIKQLGNSNHELKNKLSLLERSTIDLNWERDSLLIKGGALQPPLARILQESFDVWMMFSNRFKDMSDRYREIDVRKAKKMAEFCDSFKFDFECSEVRNLLAITQYINNEKAVS